MRYIRIMWKKVSLFSFALFIAAQTNAIPTGQWVLNLGPRTLMIVSLVPPVTPGDAVSGSITVPHHFQTSDGWSFSHIQGDASTKPIVASSWKGNAISFTVRNPADAFRYRYPSLHFERPVTCPDPAGGDSDAAFRTDSRRRQ